MTDTLILVRHGEAEGSRPGMLLGRRDLRLSETGRRQAAAVRDALADLVVDRFVCSPLLRARETAEIMVAGREAPAGRAAVPGTTVLEMDPGLREIDFGDWEGRNYADIETDDPAGARAWSEFSAGFAFPSGESIAEFSARVSAAARSLARGEGPLTVAVAHGGVIRALICHYLGLPLRDYLLFEVALGSMAVLRIWEERGVLAGLWRPGVSGKGIAL